MAFVNLTEVEARELAEQVKAARIRLNLTQPQAAQRFGGSVSLWNDVEAGQKLRYQDLKLGRVRAILDAEPEPELTIRVAALEEMVRDLTAELRAVVRRLEERQP